MHEWAHMWRKLDASGERLCAANEGLHSLSCQSKAENHPALLPCHPASPAGPSEGNPGSVITWDSGRAVLLSAHCWLLRWIYSAFFTLCLWTKLFAALLFFTSAPRTWNSWYRQRPPLIRSFQTKKKKLVNAYWSWLLPHKSRTPKTSISIRSS